MQMYVRKLEGKSVFITGQQGATLLVIAEHFINEASALGKNNQVRLD
jgi:hypothetical protein